MTRILLLLFTILKILAVKSQENSSITDSAEVKKLQEVIIKAYELHSKLQNIPAAMNYVGPSQLNRFSNTSIVSAINATTGIKMEERSPGSYRLNIRGSSLRSPFGVRNVKIYFNNIPFTDPGGNSYLNQIGFYDVQSIEILKGPGSSLYGAGTGGVLLIESMPEVWNPAVKLDFSIGSYKLRNVNLNVKSGKENFQNMINYQHQESNGYRVHTKLDRDNLLVNTVIKANEKNELSTCFFYGDLYYQTPGALTLNEYNTNPRSARPTVGTNPGAEESRAAFFLKTFLAGASYTKVLNSTWKNTTTLYGAFSQLKNPTLRNYARSSEPNLGGRSIFQLRKEINQSLMTLHFGAELQKGFTAIKTYSNKNGNPDTLQTDDEIENRQAFIFTQLSWQVKTWVVTLGASLNQLKVEFTRLSTTPSSVQKRTYNNELAPRVAVLKKINNHLTVYGDIAKGFSPPTTAELLPSSGIINTGLNAEHGWNYEAGFRGSLFENKLFFDFDAFQFHLDNTIVQRRDSNGADFFINAGSTSQKGIETYLYYTITDKKDEIIQSSRIWISYTYADFFYKNFKQISTDYSGKKLPSISPHTLNLGFDMVTKPGFYLLTTYNYSDRIPLNDANTAFGNAYHLFGFRLGYKQNVKNKLLVELFTGIDNLFDTKYSLGNDINAFGGRYYNAAPRRNYFVGISLKCP